MLLNWMLVDDIICTALKEDIGTGDITSLSTIPADATARGLIHAKEEGIVAGVAVAERVFKILNEKIQFTALKMDGEPVQVRDVLAEVRGPARDILIGERTALNIMQRMSGIATRTNRIAQMLTPFKTKVVDTRKTTPGLRILEKYAVRTGGGENHRFGLYDGILIKDNHIKVAGGIKQAVEKARNSAPHTLKVEVEVENLAGVREALEAGADIIMLDNMDIQSIREAVKIIVGRALIEVSGGVTEDKVIRYAEAGVDIISMGSLTHSIKALDISLDIGEIKN